MLLSELSFHKNVTGVNQNSLFGRIDFNPKVLDYFNREIKDFRCILQFIHFAYSLGDSFFVVDKGSGKFPSRFSARPKSKNLKSDLLHLSLVSERVFWNYLVNVTKSGPRVVLHKGVAYRFSRSDHGDDFDVLVEINELGGGWWRRFALTLMGY